MLLARRALYSSCMAFNQAGSFVALTLTGSVRDEMHVVWKFPLLLVTVWWVCLEWFSAKWDEEQGIAQSWECDACEWVLWWKEDELISSLRFGLLVWCVLFESWWMNKVK